MKSRLVLVAAMAGAVLAPTATARTLGPNAIEVAVPSNIEEPGVADIYASDLLKAVSRVCAREIGPVIGIAYYSYRACVLQTRLKTAQSDPTGVLAKHLGIQPTVTLAAR